MNLPVNPPLRRHSRLWGLVVKISPERRQEVTSTIDGLSHPTRSFYLMVAISTTIAAYGLLADSTAVVIGAMLVAPLMGPIFGTALGLVNGNQRLLRTSAVSEVAGMTLSVLIGCLIGLIPLRMGFGDEIAARTQPTLYDIFIALASGLAGAYAMVDSKVSPALPGVAIATALVPPLTTCGLCIADARWNWAIGAFLLFFANFLAIQIAAAVVFAAFGMSEAAELDSSTLLRRFAPSLLLLSGVTVFMTYTLVRIVHDRRFQSAAEAALTKALRTTMGAQLTEMNVERRQGQGKTREIVAAVLTPQEFTPEQVKTVEAAVRKATHRDDVHLIVRSLISRDADRSGPVFVPDTERERDAEVEAQTQFLTRATQALERQIRPIPGAQVVDVLRGAEEDAGRIQVTATVRTPTALEPPQVAEIEQALSDAVEMPVHLTVRSILTRDADSQRFLYEPIKKTERLTGAQLRFHNRLRDALNNQIRQQTPGASLREFRYRERGGRLLVLATARTSKTLGPVSARRIEAALRRFVDPRIQLVLRSELGGDATADGFLSGFQDAKVSD